jgi:hypothetical protein
MTAQRSNTRPPVSPEHLRPEQAAERFGVSMSTLARWAKDRLIGSAKINGVRFYVAPDIADVIARSVTPRKVVPIASSASTTDTESWRDLDLWRDAPAARRGAK